MYVEAITAETSDARLLCVFKVVNVIKLVKRS